MSESVQMHTINVELWTCGRLDPDQFREAFLELGYWEDDFPSDGFESMCEIFEEMGPAAWARYMDVTIAINAGEVTEMLCSTDDGREAIPYALIEAAAVVPMAFDGLTMDRSELLREAMRRLVTSQGVVPLTFDSDED